MNAFSICAVACVAYLEYSSANANTDVIASGMVAQMDGHVHLWMLVQVIYLGSNTRRRQAASRHEPDPLILFECQCRSIQVT